MSRVLVVYASQTGNTELMAEAMVDYLKAESCDVIIKTFDFDWVEPEELLEYDAVLIGTHTWDDGAMPYEVEDCYEEVEEVDISGRQVGVFGSCNSYYEILRGHIDVVADRQEN